MSEIPAILCVRTGNGFLGASAFDQDRLDKFPIGSEIEVTIKKKRSGPRHRFYFSILGAALPNLPDGLRMPSVEILHDRIKMWLGYRKEVVLAPGTVLQLETGNGDYIKCVAVEETRAYAPGSIAFTAMDDSAFVEFLQRALDFVQEHLIPGIDITLLKREAKRNLGNTYGRDAA